MSPQTGSGAAAGAPGSTEMTAAQAMANLATAGQTARSAFPKAQGAQAEAAPRQPASAPVAQGPVGQGPVGQAPVGQGMPATAASSPAAPRVQPPSGMGAAAPRRTGIGQPGAQIPPSSAVSRGPQPGAAQRAPSQVAQPPQQRQAAQPQAMQQQVTQPQAMQPQASQPQGPVSAPSQPRFPQAPAAPQDPMMTQPQQPYSSPVQPSHAAPDAGMPSQPAFGEGAQHHRRARHTGHFGPRPQHLDLANPSAWGAPEQGADLPPAVGTRRPSPRQGMPGEPTIDDVAGPRTLPMFADDDEPDNGKDLSSRRSGWLDTRDSSRRR